MRKRLNVRSIWLLGILPGLAVAALGGAFLLAWSGVYDVAASKGHWTVIEKFLRFGMENSVETHAPDVTPPRLDDPDLIRLGASHFHGGCAYCHGAPDTPISPIAESMLPAPPDLKDQVDLWTDQELFWIVKHGIKYAGMPAWVAQDRDDEVWAMVAFLRRLPALDARTYRELALGDVEIEPQGGRELATAQSTSDAVAACARCHGADDRPPLSDLVPRLHGQPASMLANALHAFARGERHSGIMQPAAVGLSERSIQKLATYYANLAPPPPPALSTEDATLADAGRQLATQGVPSADIPPCLSCHGSAALAAYPRLAGQHRAYIESQLRAWKRGARGRTPTDAIMAPIARRLSDQQIAQVATFFAGLTAADPPVEKSAP